MAAVMAAGLATGLATEVHALGQSHRIGFGFQAVLDHGVDPALTADVVERFVSSIRTRAARDALNEVSAAFESLKTLL